MTKEEYKELLEAEVYRGTKKSEWLKRYRMREENPSTNAVYLIRRFQYYASLKGGYYRRVARVAQLKLIRRYNIFVNAKTEIGAGLMLPHPSGIVLGITPERFVPTMKCTRAQVVTFLWRAFGQE